MSTIYIRLDDKHRLEDFARALEKIGVPALIEAHGGGDISYQRRIAVPKAPTSPADNTPVEDDQSPRPSAG